MPHFTMSDLTLDGLQLVSKTKLGDHRGHLSRMFCAEELAAIGWDHQVAQVNLTRTLKKGAVRGLHFQRPPHAEVKLVSCIRGEVLDVAVDLRKGSPTFGHWEGKILSSSNWHSLYIPEGFAHGFQTLSDDVEMLYVHSTAYAPDHEDGVHPLDPLIDIHWPLEITDMSERDKAFSAPQPVDFDQV